jgi:hypothetical protein
VAADCVPAAASAAAVGQQLAQVLHHSLQHTHAWVVVRAWAWQASLDC